MLIVAWVEREGFPGEVLLSFWKHGKDAGYSLKWRLSYIWDIIRFGQPHLDEVILDRETAREMGVFNEAANALDSANEILDKANEAVAVVDRLSG